MRITSSPAIEEFFNQNHSKTDGKFASGKGGGTIGIKPTQAAKKLGLKQPPHDFHSNDMKLLRPKLPGGLTLTEYHSKLMAQRQSEQTVRDTMYARTPGHVPESRKRGLAADRARLRSR